MLSKKIKIGFINQSSPFDRKASSGTTFQMYKALKNIGAEIIWLQPKINVLYNFFDLYYKLLSLTTKKRILRSHTICLAALESRSLIETEIEKCDILFAPFASTSLYSIETTKPIIYLSDATFAAMANYYFKDIIPWNIAEANEIEQVALTKASIVVLASNWAYNSALYDYNVVKSKLHVIEFGANIDEENIVPHQFVYNGYLNILFLGVDWYRKGGDIAVAACKYLNDKGIPTVLHVVGIQNLDQQVAKLSFVKNYGFLNKNKINQYKQLVSIIQDSHCLLLPTRAECAGIVFCESSANGLPIFTYNTGGVSNYVKNGENGYMLPQKSSGEEFGEKIASCLLSGELSKMSIQAVEVYKNKLNWSVWGEKMENIIESML